MVRYSIHDVAEDMVLGKSIYLPNGELLLAAGYRIKRSYIERLMQMGYHFIYVEEAGTEGIIPEELIDNQIVRELEVSLSQSFEGLEKLAAFRDDSIKDFGQMLEKEKNKFREIIMVETVKNSLKSIIDQIMDNPNVILNLSSLKSLDAYLYQHAINVAIISVSLAKKFNYTWQEIEQLAMGALCCDVGMVAVPKEIRMKGDALTPNDELLVREHTTYGFLILSKNPAIAPNATAVALQHHERQDGKGYPRGLTGDNKPPYKDLDASKKIHRFAEIVAVADTYDSMISSRPHSPPVFPPITAVKKIIEAAGEQLNKSVVAELVKMIPLYPIGMKFRIDNCQDVSLIGARGVVAKHTTEDLNKPELLILFSRKGQRLDPPRKLEMSKIPSLRIELLL